jgi:hypothetical protein
MPEEPFSLGQVQENPTRRLSSWLDTIFRPVGRPIGAILGGLARQATGIVAPQYSKLAEQRFQEAGEHLPRLAAEFAAVGAKRLPVKLAGLGDVLLRSSTAPGADIGTGLGETAAFAAAPLAGGLARRAIAPIAGAAESQFASPIGRLLARSAVQEPAGIAGSLLPFEAAGALEAYRRGQLKEHVEQLGSPEHIVSTLAGVLPFEAARIPAGVRAFTGALVNKTPITDSVDVHRVHWMAGEVPRFRDFGSEESAKDFSDEVRRTVGGEPKIEAAGSVPRQRVVYDMAFKPGQLRGGFGLNAVEMLNEPTTSALRLSPDKEGLFDTKNLVGRMRNVLHPTEFKSYEDAGLGEFLKEKKKVGAVEVQQWIEQNGPRVETRVGKTSGEKQRSTIQQLLDRANVAQHGVETLGYKIHEEEGPLNQGLVRDNVVLKAQGDQIYKYRLEGRAGPVLIGQEPLAEAHTSIQSWFDTQKEINRIGATQEPGTDVHWQSIAPTDVTGKSYVEIAVTRPIPGNIGNKGIVFPASHSFPPNTLGWSRGYMETLPDGKKVFHVVEVQSDWAQRQRELVEVSKETEALGNRRLAQEQRTKLSDPLLADWSRLVLKASIDHAIKEGADEIAISDAETAMMTEGHDLPSNQNVNEVFNSKSGAEERAKELGGMVVQEPGGFRVVALGQFPGMRLNYDQILPKIAEELTGVKGRRVVMGEHKNAFTEMEGEQEVEVDPDTGEQYPVGEGGVFNVDRWQGPRPDLIFKNPDGTPKTSITGLSFNLSKAKTELEKRGGWSVFARDKIVRDQVQRMDVEGYEPDEILRASENVKLLQPLKGEDALQTLARSVGIDPKVFARLGPGESLERAFDFFTSVYHHNFGETPERAAYLARQTMTPLARFAPFLKQTAFAVAPAQEGASHLFTVPRPLSETAQYLTTLADIPKAAKGTVSPETMVFEMARMAGHEAAHNMGTEVLSPTGSATPQQRQSWIKAMANVEAIPPQERAKVMQNMMQLVVPPSRYNEVSKINMERYATEPEEFLADFAALISVGSLNGKMKGGLEDLMQFGDRASQNFGQAVYRDLASMWGTVRDWMRVSMGYKPDAQAKSILQRVDNVYKNITSLLQTHEQAERTFATFNAFMDRTSTGPLEPPPVVSATQMHKLFKELDDVNAYASHATGKKVETTQQDMKLFDELLSHVRPQEASERAAGERLTFWKSFFNPMIQLAESLKEKVPSAIPITSLAFDFRGQVSDTQTAAWRMFQSTEAYKKEHPIESNLSGGIDWKRLKWISKEGSAQERALNKIQLSINVRQQEEGVNTLPTRKEMEDLSSEYKGLNDVDKERVDLSIEQFNAMNRLLAKRQWDSFRDRVVTNMEKSLMSHNKNMFEEQAYDLTKKAVDLIFDEPVGATFDEQIAFAQQRFNFMESLPMSDDARKMFLDSIRSMKEPWLKLGDQLLGSVGQDGLRPGKNYMPEVRTREWHVSWKIALEDKQHHEAYNTEAEAVAKKKALEGRPDLEYVKSFNRSDRTDRVRGAVQEQISSVQQEALDVLKKTVLASISREHPEAVEIVKKIEAELQPAAAFAELTVSPYMRKREFIPGRENLNMAEGVLRYVDATAYQMAKRHVKQKSIATLFNPDMRSNPNVRNEYEKYIDFVTNAEGPEFDMLKNLVFFNYIGFNPTMIPIELTQQLVTLVPYMVEHGFSPRKVYRTLREVNRDLLSINVKHEGKLKDVGEQAALERAESGRVIDTGFTADLHGEADLDFAAGRSNTLGNGAIGEGVDLLRNSLYQMLAVSRKAYAWGTTANGRVALTTAYRLSREISKATTEELKDKEAYAFARQATHATMFGGGRANRPLVLQRFGELSGVGGVMYTLGSYTLNTMAMMARLTRKAIQAQLKNPQEVAAATKAAGIMWATQFALGGILGLPLIAPGIALLEQVFKGLDARKAMREGLVNLAGEDEDMGHYVADGAMRGVLNLSSVDFGSRFQLGSLLGVSPYDGFSWRNLMGPAATMLENYGKGISQASEGRWGDAARQAAPTSIKNILNLVHDDWAIRDRAGRLINELTPTEKTLAAIGFKPKKLTQYYEQQSIMERSEQRKQREVRDVRSEVAKLLVQGDVAGARRRIIEGMQEVGPYDPLDMAREAAQLAQEITTSTPIPPGSKANMAEQADIARLYPRGTTQSEQQRVLRQAFILRELGLSTGRPDIRSIRTAGLVDQYLRQNPRANIAQARAAVERLTSPAVRRREALFR